MLVVQKQVGSEGVTCVTYRCHMQVSQCHRDHMQVSHTGVTCVTYRCHSVTGVTCRCHIQVSHAGATCRCHMQVSHAGFTCRYRIQVSPVSRPRMSDETRERALWCRFTLALRFRVRV